MTDPTTEAGKRHRHYWRWDESCRCGQYRPGTDEADQQAHEVADEAVNAALDKVAAEAAGWKHDEYCGTYAYGDQQDECDCYIALVVRAIDAARPKP